MYSPKSILVPTDFSEYSDKALQVARDLAKQFKSRIYLLHVVGTDVPYLPYYALDRQTVDLVEKGKLAAARKKLDEQLGKFPVSKSIKITTVIRQGDPYYELILNEQQEKKIQLIVIASHGKTGLLSHLIGSVAERVLRSAQCPVLLVR